MNRKPCNVALGRFQPFTKGHLQMLKDGYDKNGYPAVVFMISNKKFDSKHPFSDELIAKEMDIIKKNYKFVADTVPADSADIVKIGQKLAEMGYEAHLWLCGDDREAQFKRQAENPKYREQGQFPDDFTTYTGTGRTEGVSGTAVRNALKADDKEAFKKLVPDGVDGLFNDLKEEIDKVQESLKNLDKYVMMFETKELQSEELHHEIGLALQQFGNIKNGFKMSNINDIKDAMYKAGFDYDEEESNNERMVFVGEYINTDYEVTLFISDRVTGKVKISNFNEIEL